VVRENLFLPLLECDLSGEAARFAGEEVFSERQTFKEGAGFRLDKAAFEILLLVRGNIEKPPRWACHRLLRQSSFYRRRNLDFAPRMAN
jgi:hypothetical protein